MGPHGLHDRPIRLPAQVVVLLDDVSILDGLDAALGEVAHVFDCPLEALPDPELAHGEKNSCRSGARTSTRGDALRESSMFFAHPHVA